MTKKKQPRVLFYFLHLLGVGHVHRAQRLISGMSRQGIAVDAIIGGEELDIHFDCDSVTHLPAIKAADNSYSNYLDADGNPLTQPYLEMREAQLLNRFSELHPDLILIEAYPFGRRMVHRELQALLKSAQSRKPAPLVVTSVRDILQEKRKPGRAEETRDIVMHDFDHVLVHSDPNVIRLDATFAPAAAIAEKIKYTGFVVPAEKSDTEKHSNTAFDVIVSAGGGAFGGGLMKTAMDLAERAKDCRGSPLDNLTWCFATGPNLDEASFNTLAQRAPEGVTVVRSFDSLATALAKAKISISQCGYNTAMDALSMQSESDCRVVFVPYDTEGQTEQKRRAELLAQSGRAISLPQSELTDTRLEEAAQRALSLPINREPVDMNGVENTARIIRNWIDEYRSRNDQLKP